MELLLLSVLWGAAYLFVRAAVPAFGPAPLVALRLGVAVLVLLPVLAWRGGWLGLRSHPRQLAMLGVPYTALPFMLLSYASLYLSAGLVAVLCATAPMFAALQNHLRGRETLSPVRVAGLLIGMAGVLLLMWGDVQVKSGDGLLAVAAVLGTSVLWGVGANYARNQLGSINPLVVSVGSLFAASAFLTPFAWQAWPAQPPDMRAWAELLFLGVLSSGLGFLMYFRLLRNIGAVRAMSVTFLNPLVAIFAAALYLGEAVTPQMLAGCAVVLFGTALSLGVIGRAAQPAPARPVA